jgi:uncharacterized oligopeptide transporter (OPT) family protein
MGHLQRPARTPEEIARSGPLELSPDEVAELDEAAWYDRVYRGDELPQLTLRALLMGSALGFLLSFTNLYIGLKTGWGLGVAITACILSFTIWNALLKAKLARSPMSILENNCMQSTASAAGYSTGNGMISSIPALLMMSVTPALPGGRHIAWPVLAAWTFFVAMLGVCLAIPMKRNLVNQERLRFPSGLAAAVTLQSLYSHGAAAVAKARMLLWSALVASLGPLLIDLRWRRVGDGRAAVLPDSSKVFDFLPAPGHDPKTGAALRPSDWTMVLDHKLVMVAAGALIGLRVTLSLLAGALVLALWLGPRALAVGAVTAPGDAWHEIGIWVGGSIMIASGLVSFGTQWRTVVRAFTNFRRGAGPAAARARAVEVPSSWFLAGAAISGVALTIIGRTWFGISITSAVVAVVLSFVLALVAGRATGETDITPVGAMGQITQLTYGAVLRSPPTTNLMTAGLTSVAALCSADLLTDLKSGYLLGANPRRQFLAQLCGIFAGTIAAVAGWYLLVPDATALTGSHGQPPPFPAPGAQSFLAVAKLFERGLSQLAPFARAGLVWGLVLGVALELLAQLAPERVRRFVPSAMGIGLGLMLPFQYPLSMVIGAFVAWLWQRRRPESAEHHVIPLSSGIIAGESIVGVIVAALNNFVL